MARRINPDTANEKTEARIEWVIEKLERTPRDSAVVRAVQREFGVGARQAREYVRAAYEHIRAMREDTKPFDFERMLSAKFDVYEKAMADRERALSLLDEHGSAGMEPGDQAKVLSVAVRALQVANGASDQATKMTGGYAPAKVEIAGAPLPLGMTDEEYTAAVLEEAERLGGRRE